MFHNTQYIDPCYIEWCTVKGETEYRFHPMSHTASDFNSYARIRRGPCINGEKSLSTMNLFFSWIKWTARYVYNVIPEKRWYQDTPWESNNPIEAVWWVWVIFFLGKHKVLSFPCKSTLSRTNDFDIIENQVHPFIATRFDGGCGIFRQNSTAWI